MNKQIVIYNKKNELNENRFLLRTKILIKIKISAKKKLTKDLIGSYIPGGNFPGAFFRGAFSPEAFFLELILIFQYLEELICLKKSGKKNCKIG